MSNNPRYPRRDQTPEPIGKLFDRMPPGAPEAEMSLLGAMIVAGGSDIHIIADVVGIIAGPEDFEKPAHQALYQVLIDLYDRNRSLDSVQIIQELRTRSLLEQVGGADYVIQLAESVPIAENAPHYAGLVSAAAKRRALIRASSKILRDAYESSDPPDELMDRAEQAIFDIAETKELSGAQHISPSVDDTISRIESRIENPNTRDGLALPWWKLDADLNGLERSKMIVVGARPAMGKTSWMLNIIEHLAIGKGVPLALYSLEMDRNELNERLLSGITGIDNMTLRRGQMDMREWPRITDAAERIRQAPIYVDDASQMTLAGIRASARRMASRHGIKGVFVDHLHLVSHPGAENRRTEVAAISRGLKSLAKELALPVIVLAQLNRNPEGRHDSRPHLSDLKETGDIEQDSNVVIFLHREEYYHRDDPVWLSENPQAVGAAEIIISKNRSGPTGTVMLRWDGPTTRFVDEASRAAARAVCEDAATIF